MMEKSKGIKKMKQGCFLCEHSTPTFSFNGAGIMRIKCAIKGEVIEKLDCKDSKPVKFWRKK